MIRCALRSFGPPSSRPKAGERVLRSIGPPFLRARELEGEGAALADRALDGDGAAHGAGEVGADGEAEADPFARVAEAALHLHERVEDGALLLLGDAGAGVVHGEGDAFAGG